MSLEVVDGQVKMAGYEQLTVSNTAVALTSAKYRQATVAVIRVSHDIRYTLDVDNADLTISASLGMPWNATDGDLVVPIESLATFRMIRATGSDATADCLYIIR